MKKGQMKNLKPVTMIVVVALLLAAALLSNYAQAQTTTQQRPRYGGTLRICNLGADGISVGYPPKLLRAQSNRIAGAAIETLIHSDKTGKPVPWLATGFKEDAKAKSITLTLRKGVKFHDGTDFNAEAVKWNLSQCMSAKNPGTEKFKSIDMIDDYTVRINLTEWDSTVINNLTQTIGLMISPTAYNKNGEAWCASHPVGTGPFQFVSWQKDVRWTFSKFDGYWQKGKPYLDRIEFIIITDSVTQELSFRAKELDLWLTMTPKAIPALEKESYGITRGKPGSGAYGLIPDSANPKSPWADVRVRQAAQYAMDTEAIVKGLFFGEHEPANQYIYKRHWGYNPSVVGYPYHPTKAKQLLSEAGYPNGFKTKLFCISDPEINKPYIAAQGYLKAVGIDAEVELFQQGKLVELAYGGKWEGLLVNSISPNPDVVATLATKYSGDNYKSMLLPDDYLKAIQNAIIAPDFEMKQKWTQEVMKLMVDKYCLQMMIYSPTDFAVAQTYVRNHGFNETPNTGLWTPEDAWMDR